MKPKPTGGRTRRKQTEAYAAQVFLRSVSGKSIHALGQGPLPADLSPYRAAPSARDEAVRALQKRGFRVFPDEAGLTVAIEGSPALFAKTFGVPEKRLLDVSAADTLALAPPKELEHVVENIFLMPRPEWFSTGPKRR
jgi:hypothetical protein